MARTRQQMAARAQLENMRKALPTGMAGLQAQQRQGSSGEERPGSGPYL